jgi:hypothetical protein
MVAAGVFDGEDVLGLLDDAHYTAVSSIAAASRAWVRVSDIVAGRADLYPLLERDNRPGEKIARVGGGAEQMEGNPLGALRSDTGQFAQFLDEVSDRVTGRSVSHLQDEFPLVFARTAPEY